MTCENAKRNIVWFPVVPEVVPQVVPEVVPAACNRQHRRSEAWKQIGPTRTRARAAAPQLAPCGNTLGRVPPVAERKDDA